MSLKTLVEEQKTLVAQRALINKEAMQSGGFDLASVTVITGTDEQKIAQIGELDKKIGDVGSQISTLQTLEAAATADAFRVADENAAETKSAEVEVKNRPREGQSWGEYFAQGPGKQITGAMSIDELKAQVTKTTNPYASVPGSSSFGRGQSHPAPQYFTDGIAERLMFGPQGFVSMLPTRPVSSGEFTWMMESLRDETVDGIPEDTLYPESEYAFERRSMLVRKIGTSYRVTDEQMQDGPAMVSEIENNILLALRNRINRQLWSGANTEYQIAGLKWWLDASNGSGKWNADEQVTKTGAASSWDDPGDSSRAPRGYKAIADAYVALLTRTNEAPTAIVIHPISWQKIMTAFNNNFGFIGGNPTSSIGRDLWGMPVVLDAYLPQDTALMGNFQQGCRIVDRKEISLVYGYTMDDFLAGRESARADARLQFYVTNTARFQMIKNAA